MAGQYRLRKMLAVHPSTPLEQGPTWTVHHEPAYEILISWTKDHTASLTVHQSDLDERPESSTKSADGVKKIQCADTHCGGIITHQMSDNVLGAAFDE